MDHVTPRFDLDDHDPELDRLLASLGHFSPRPRFEDRVMAQVRVPPPYWLQELQGKGRALAASGRVRPLARRLVAASVISITIVAVLVVANAAAVSAFVGSALGGVALAAWRTVLGVASALAIDIYAALGFAGLSATAVAAAAVAATAVASFNAWALYRLMQPPARAGVRLHATD